MECTLSTNNDLHMDRSNPLHDLSQKIQEERPRNTKEKQKEKIEETQSISYKTKAYGYRVTGSAIHACFTFHLLSMLLFFSFFFPFFLFLETELLRLTKHDNSIYRFCNGSLNVLYYYDLLHPLGQLWQALGIRLTKSQTLFFLSYAPYYRPTCICTCICTVFPLIYLMIVQMRKFWTASGEYIIRKVERSRYTYR